VSKKPPPGGFFCGGLAAHLLDAHTSCAYDGGFAMRVKEDRPGYAKRAANLSVNAQLLDEARAFDINLSATMERALEEAIRGRKRERWLAENRDAIEAYNARIERDGVFSDGLRSF
jgi:antitoxin CcdA